MFSRSTHILLSFSFLILGIPLSRLSAQNLGDTLHLSEIEIKANYPVNNQGFKKVRIDSALLAPQINADLSTILSQHSTVFIKTYGNGSLATPSFRGTSANHTQVEWNGININSPMLGQIDLAQIPVSQFDNVEILYGAAGISRTSGAFGGVINLVTNPQWNNIFSMRIAQTFASFNTYTTDIFLTGGTPKVQSTTKFNYTSSVNDFPYYNDQTKEREKQQNGSYYAAGLSEELFFKIKNKNFLSARVWYSQYLKNIPPITTIENPLYNEKQEDHSLRSLLEWKRVESRYSLTLSSAFVDQFQNYKGDSNLNANHNNYSWISRFRFSYTGVSKLTIRPGIDYSYDWVFSDSYDGKKTRSTLGIFFECIYQVHRKVGLSLVLREDLIDDNFLPLIPALGVEYKPFNKIDLSFSGNLSRNYKYPTLNQLYWSVSGNPDLKPETDYAAELSVVYNFLSRNKNFFLESEITGYYSRMLELIMWKPVEGSSFLWKPENIDEVLARGFEAGLNLSYQVYGFKFALDNNYNYCRSTNEKTGSENDASLGKQLIYVPIHTFNSTFMVKKWGFELYYNFIYISKRYTGTDNETFMPAYKLSNIIFGKNFILKKIVLSLQLQINNLFNLDYQSIANRPMPGRNYALTLKFNFNK